MIERIQVVSGGSPVYGACRESTRLIPVNPLVVYILDGRKRR
jgi:hypothetical protein